jgi:hypothetical protein
MQDIEGLINSYIDKVSEVLITSALIIANIIKS